MNSLLNSSNPIQGLPTFLNMYNFPHDYTPTRRLQSYRYLLQYPNYIPRRGPTRDDLLRSILLLFDQLVEQRDVINVRECADIIITFFPGLRDRALAGIRRSTRPIVTAPIPPTPPAKQTVYNDKQNVHNTEINATVNRANQKLFQLYGEIIAQSENKAELRRSCLETIRQELIKHFPHQAILINNSIDYFHRSIAVINDITIQDTLICVWLWIVNHPTNRTELLQRLLEEFEEMSGQCTSGHLSRLLNVLQGYATDPDLQVRISDKDQCNAIVRQYLTTQLAGCTDEKIADGLLNPTEPYKQFIRQAIKNKLPEWEKDYGPAINKYLPSIVNSFAGTTIY